MFGEDVAVKGGVYGVTRGLRKRFGAARVFDTLLDEQTDPRPGAGRRAVRAAADPGDPVPGLPAQRRGPAARRGGHAAVLLQRAVPQPDGGAHRRLGYQQGFGGHFHNDNAVAVLRDIPGLVIASPAPADDAAAMLRTCVAAAERPRRVCVFLEPIALYHTRDLHDRRRRRAGSPPYPDGEHVPVGRARSYGDGTRPDHRHVRQRAADEPAGGGAPGRRRHPAAGCVDLRWLAPLPVEDMLREADACRPGAGGGRDPAQRRGVARASSPRWSTPGSPGAMARVTSKDSFIPLGAAALHVLVSEDEIEAAARKLVDAGPRSDRRRSAAHPYRS